MSYNLLDQNIGSYAVLNNQIFNINSEFISQLEKYSSSTQCYEIIRCIDGVLLFFDDHMERLKKTASNIQIDVKQIKNDAYTLINQEKIENGNLKIIVTENISLLFASKFYYPTKDEYSKGVNAGLMEYDRLAPNKKIIHSNGYITEGSRSNVFFVIGESVITAPDHLILKGVTRKYVYDAIKKAGSNVIEACIKSEDIFSKHAFAFITGTSTGVMPLYSIENNIINSATNELIIRIRYEYNNLVREHIKKNKD